MSHPTSGAGTASVGELREQALPWLDQAADVPPRTVDSADRADLAAWDAIRGDCKALAKLDADLTRQYGTPGLVGDVWMAAYSREPQLRAAGEIGPGQRSNRAITAGMLDSPEHAELRQLTVGDPYAAAMSVLGQAPKLRQMLRELDPAGQQKAAQRAHEQANRAAQRVAGAFQAAQDAAADAAAGGSGAGSGGQPSEAVDTANPNDPNGQTTGDIAGELDGLPVPRPQVVDVQRAIADAAAADADAARADQAVARLGKGDPDGDQAMMRVRATARDACAEAAEQLAAELAAMVSWGLGKGEQERMSADERMRLAEKLKSGKLAKFASLVGRFKQMAAAQRARRVEHVHGEYVGVTLGNDLTSLLPSELVNLAVPALRAQFAVRFAEAQLMVYDQRGDEHEGQGAVIVCIDCSDSMTLSDDHGITGEAYAKALALAMLDQARAAKPVREFVAILFSHTTDATIRFPADQPVNLADRIRLAETFSAGGTDFEAPLTSARTLLEAEYNATGRQRADIVFITDGEAYLGERWLDRWHEQKRKLGFRCFGIQIGWWADEEGADVLDSFCDDVRRIEDLADTHASADLFRSV
jgi:uncharacterized protein with von Willebrand factor type A (vWA) domain